jgi:hypothetical protein
MTPRATKKFGHSPRQLTINECLALNPTDALKVAMNEAIKGSCLSREQIVDVMNRLAAAAGINHDGKNRHITPDILDKWCARGSIGHQIPVKYLPLFCQATGSLLPLEALASPLAMVITGEDILLLKWAQIEKNRRSLTKESRRIAQEAGI